MQDILEQINGPADLKSLSAAQLPVLADQVRDLIIQTVSQTGGHLAANLGVVELTIALLRVFNPLTDRLIWDVSHQTYAYKILTDRRKRFPTLRQHGGISGFLKRDESPCDAFGAGHSGTAVSAALGMAAERDLRNGTEHIVAIVGDGAIGCGITLEAFNNVAQSARRLIVILNDNEMSISANVGAISQYLGGLLANPRYNRWKSSVENLASRMHMRWLRKTYFKIEEALKSMFLRSILFEEFGLRYIGPIDGHNLPALIDAIQVARNYDRPILLHVSTQKGRGYSFAEQRPDAWHGTPAFDIDSGTPSTDGKPSYSELMGRTLEGIAATDDRITAITAAMPAGTGLASFAARFPTRFFDVGICEEHAVVFAAGLAAAGRIPVFAVYSTFMQRAVDCLLHDVCLQNLHVILCLDRAGIVGDDGPTHHGVFDIAMLRPIPGLVFMQPADQAELAGMLQFAATHPGPVAIRYPRGAAPAPDPAQPAPPIALARANQERPGDQAQIWALGDMLPIARKAADILTQHGIRCGVVNARFIKPLDTTLLANQAATATCIATLENGVLSAGFGSAVLEFVASTPRPPAVLRFGWPDDFVVQGRTDQLLSTHGITPDNIAQQMLARLR